jgi:cytochrome c5
MGHLLLALLVVAASVACGTTLQEQREIGLRNAKNDLERGRVYYETSCQRCHALYMPRTFTARSWGRYVRRYGPRARLDEAQKRLVLDYLRANARDAAATTPASE